MKMTRVVLVLALVAAVALSLPAATSLAQEVLTNDSVVQMIKAGLPESVVISKIRSTATKFDLRTESLVSLKKNGVSDKVLEAMMAPGSPAAGTPAAPPAATTAGGSLRDRDTIYHLTGGTPVEMFATSANLETNMVFFQSKSEVVLEGRKAKYRMADKLPVFLSTYGPTDAPLVKLKPGDSNDDRNLKISSGAFMPFGGTQKMGVRN
ncbi:MAG: hypothetical protein ACREJS_02510, partial [Candidatus Rokuibacteriota bacterium]